MKNSSLNMQQKHRCIEETQKLIRQASGLFQLSMPNIDVQFDLRGRASGMYVVRGNQRWIRYNSLIFAKYFTESLQQTIPHEVAHYVCDRRFGLSNIRPHGKEWRQIMIQLGAKPQTQSNYDISDLPIRSQQRFRYRCQCTNHAISCTRHNKIRRQQAQYLCRLCGEALVYVGS